ncbi:MAG: IPT/TIG domain-containing protein, partial [Chloroflexota bacterium]|nr:IPT/TIG domain-containing protein [Chloroflexota bacterium]
SGLSGTPPSIGMLSLSNSTVSGNSAIVLGGGMYLDVHGSAILMNDTVTGNSVSTSNGGSGGGIYKDNLSAAATLANTIVANNTAPASGASPDVFGQFSDGGHNLIHETDGSTGFTDVSMGGTDYTGTIAFPRDPGLVALPLANNGGPTPTEAILSTSIAVNHGDNTICTSQTGPAPVAGKDQRGVLRPQGSACDIGAYEYLILTLNGTTIPTSGGTATLTGTGFQPGLTLTVDGVNTPVTNVASDGTALTATFHPHLSGNVTASVSEPTFAPAPATTMLTYANFTPAVQSISPTSGSVAGGASVTITGAYFAPGASVTFGSTAAQHVTVVSDTKITATTPAASASGAVNVNVTVQGLTGTLTNGYTYGVVNPVPSARASAPPNGHASPIPTSRPPGVSISGSPNPIPPSR